MDLNRRGAQASWDSKNQLRPMQAAPSLVRLLEGLFWYEQATPGTDSDQAWCNLYSATRRILFSVGPNASGHLCFCRRWPAAAKAGLTAASVALSSLRCRSDAWRGPVRPGRRGTLSSSFAVSRSVERTESRWLSAVFSSDHEPIAHPWHRWRLRARALVLHRARTEMVEDDILTSLTTQRALQQAILARQRPAPAASVLQVRLDRWRRLEPRATSPARLLLARHARWSVLHLSRTQFAGRSPLFSSLECAQRVAFSKIASVDKVEHRPDSAALTGVAARRLGLGRSPLQFYLLEDEKGGDPAFSRVVLLCIRRSWLTIRYARAHCVAGGGMLVWACIRAALAVKRGQLAS